MMHHEALYFNGLGNGQTKPWEAWVFKRLADKGVHLTHAHMDWRSDETFNDLLDRMTELAKEQLRKHGRIALVGSSAGCSLALNIFGRLKDDNDVVAVSLCGRLHPGQKFPWWDKRTLERMAYIGTDKASQAFYDSVMYCDQETIPSLIEQDKQRIIVVKQLADFVVPRVLMDIEGIEPLRVPGSGHGMGIAMGAMRLPQILDDLAGRR